VEKNRQSRDRHAWFGLCLAVLATVSCRDAGAPAPADGGVPHRGLELIAGSIGGPGSADGAGPTARFDFPTGAAIDSAGNVYVADQRNHTIRKVSPDGIVTTLAGSAGVPGSADGAGTAARFRGPTGVAVDRAGNVYVADRYNHIIRRITATGDVTTLAGAAGVPGSDDGAGAAARFNVPTGVAVDGAGNVYVADGNNREVRKITAAGAVTTLVGVSLVFPAGITVDGTGNVYVADASSSSCAIVKITPGAVVTTLAGGGSPGSVDGTGAVARFNMPGGVTVDSAGNVYVADRGSHMLRKITPAGDVTTLAGSARKFGKADGAGAAARFRFPAGITIDGTGNLYVADQGNHTLRKVTPGGDVTTLAGAAGTAGSADGTGVAARFNAPGGIAADDGGNLYVADRYNQTLRRITPTGDVTTLAGSASLGGSVDGKASDARFRMPSGVALDGAGNLYVADLGNQTLRRVTPAEEVTTLVGTPRAAGSTDGTGAAARFHFPAGAAVDRAGNIYVADQFNRTIRKITPAGEVTTLAGTAGMVGSTDGNGAAARFGGPVGIAVDSDGNVYVADKHAIRKITAGGDVTTLAGVVDTPGSDDGTGAAARFYFPAGIALDSTGNVYVADQFNSTIRRITRDGITTTLAGTPGAAGILLGAMPRFAHPQGLAITGDSIAISDGDAVLLLRHGTR
jgi:sugar lactone lactonase YvrE